MRTLLSIQKVKLRPMNGKGTLPQPHSFAARMEPRCRHLPQGPREDVNSSLPICSGDELLSRAQRWRLPRGHLTLFSKDPKQGGWVSRPDLTRSPQPAVQRPLEEAGWHPLPYSWAAQLQNGHAGTPRPGREMRGKAASPSPEQSLATPEGRPVGSVVSGCFRAPCLSQ